MKDLPSLPVDGRCHTILRAQETHTLQAALLRTYQLLEWQKSGIIKLTIDVDPVNML